jgi:hypothetical protein
MDRNGSNPKRYRPLSSLLLVILCCLASAATIAFFQWQQLSSGLFKRLGNVPQDKIVDYARVTPVRIAGLVAAIDNYTNEYRRFPIAPLNNSNEIENRLLMEILSGHATNAAAVRQNPMKLEFLYFGSGVTNGQLVDQWRHPLHIVFGSNGFVVIGGESVPVSIAIWSDGSNGRNEYGRGDDVTSWK